MDTQTGIITQVTTNPRGGRFCDATSYRLNATGSHAVYIDSLGHPQDKCGLYVTEIPSGPPPIEFPITGEFPSSAAFCNGDSDIACATTWDLVVINRASGNVTTLRSGPSEYYSVAVSPDGQRIAYVESLPSGALNTNLCVCAIDGSGQRVLSQVGVVGEYGMPAWSPDGAEIVYALRVPSGAGAITSLNAVLVEEAIHRTILPFDSIHVDHPVWIAGGIYLTVFEAHPDGERGSIFYRADAGGELMRVTTAPPGRYGLDLPTCYRP